MDLVFIETLINPLEVAMDYLEFSNVQKDVNVLILDVFNVIAPEDVAGITSLSSRPSLPFEIFKPLEPDDIVSFILSLKLNNSYNGSFLFVTDYPEIIPGRYTDYDAFFLVSLLKDIEEDRRMKVVLFSFVENESQIDKTLDLFRLTSTVDNYLRYRRDSRPPFIKISSHKSNPNVEEKR